VNPRIDPFELVAARAVRPADVADAELAAVRARFTELTGVDLDPPTADEPTAHHLGPAVAPLRPRRARRPSRRRLLPAVAVAAVVALIALVAVAVRPDDAPTDVATVPAVPGPLDALADVVAAQPEPAADWGQQYVRGDVRRRVVNSVEGSVDPVPSINETTTEVWMARDGTWVEVSGDTTISTEGTTPLDLTGGLPAGSRTYEPGSVTGQLAADELAALPVDPAALESVLAAQRSALDDVELDPLMAAAALLEQPAVRPAVRAALIRDIAAYPGVEQSQGSIDGRPLIEATYRSDERDLTLSFDEATGELVGTRITATRPIEQVAARPGDVLLDRTIDQRGLVADLGDRP